MNKPSEETTKNAVVLEVRGLNIHYGEIHVLKDVNLSVLPRTVHAIIGTSGSGKTTLLRALSRNLDMVDGPLIQGEILMEGSNIYAEGTDANLLRKQICYVSQTPNLLARTVIANLSFAVQYWYPDWSTSDVEEHCFDALRKVGLDERSRDFRNLPAHNLSIGEQQKVSIARALAINPKVLLLDEPTANMDVLSALTLEEHIDDLRSENSILVITHSMQQAARISQHSSMLHMGSLIESADTMKIFTNPEDERTENYIRGRFG